MEGEYKQAEETFWCILGKVRPKRRIESEKGCGWREVEWPRLFASPVTLIPGYLRVRHYPLDNKRYSASSQCLLLLVSYAKSRCWIPPLYHTTHRLARMCWNKLSRRLNELPQPHMNAGNRNTYTPSTL